MRRSILAAAAATVFVSSAALAAVTFDFSTGMGFVGKGDVQTAFGWNNAQLQGNAAGVSFFVDDTATYSAVCTFVTGEGTPGEKTHDVTIPRHVSVNSDVQYDARTHRQIDGFELTGYGDEDSSGDIPVVGQTCVAQDSNGIAQNGTWSSVTLISASGGGLYVSFGGTDVLLLSD
jgi:hypothetical protein